MGGRWVCVGGGKVVLRDLMGSLYCSILASWNLGFFFLLFHLTFGSGGGASCWDFTFFSFERAR